MHSINELSRNALTSENGTLIINEYDLYNLICHMTTPHIEGSPVRDVKSIVLTAASPDAPYAQAGHIVRLDPVALAVLNDRMNNIVRQVHELHNLIAEVAPYVVI